MAKFLALYVSPMSAEEQMKTASPEGTKKAWEMWMQWFQTNGPMLVDGGSPLGSEARLTETGTQAHAGDYTCGYSMIEANDLEAAKALFVGHPHFMQEGNTIQILEALPAPGM